MQFAGVMHEIGGYPVVGRCRLWSDVGAAEVAEVHQVPDGPDHARRIEHDVPVEHAQRRIAALGKETVPGAVTDVVTPALVELVTVRLDDDAPLDEQVHAAHTVDAHLDVAAQTGVEDQLPEHRFLPGIRPSIDPESQGPVLGRHVGENIGDVGGADLALMQRRVERGQREIARLALDDLGQGIPSSDAVLRAVSRVEERSPVQFDAIAPGIRQPHEAAVRRAQARPFPLDVEMSELRIEGEDPQFVRGRHTGQTTADTDRLYRVAIGPRPGVVIAAHPEQGSGADREGDLGSGHSRGEQIMAMDDASRTEVQAREGGHAAIVTALDRRAGTVR